MVDYSNPFLQSLGNIRTQSQQNQFTQPQQDFSGWGDRLNKIEQGIAGLTDQFNNFQKPGDVAPEYTGNAAPEPLGQSANAPEPLEGIESLAPTPAAPMGGQTPSPFGGGQLGRHMTYQPGQEGFTPLTAEQFASQQDLFGQQQDYTDFSNMAAGIAGLSNSPRYKGGANPAFGHAYEAWQGADQSQGMENWMQDYSFDLSPGRPEWQPGQSIQNIMQDHTSSPEYQAWQQREEGRGPLSQSTLQAMGGVQHTGGPDIDPFISMGIGSPTATPTYEGYMDMVNQQAAGYRPQTTATSPNFSSPGAGGLAGLVNNRGLGALQGPTQQKIQQGYQV